VKTSPEQPARPGGEPSPAAEPDLPVVEPGASADAERAAEAAEDLEVTEVEAERVAGGTPAPGSEAAALAELRDKWLRAEADIQNLRRRSARDREEQRREIEDQWLLELVALQDDLDRALATARESGAPEAWTKGVELVRGRIDELLARHGVTPIDPAGTPFDPTLHDALLEVDAPPGAKPGTVVQVVTRGFARGGRALRAARVVVARGSAEAKERP
jgi:molecular chaperone GrpE